MSLIFEYFQKKAVFLLKIYRIFKIESIFREK